MKKYVYNPPLGIPNYMIEDCKKLMEFMRSNMGIEISLNDTYRFWSDVSDSWDAVWLNIDSHYDRMTREEFLQYELEKRGYFIEI